MDKNYELDSVGHVYIRDESQSVPMYHTSNKIFFKSTDVNKNYPVQFSTRGPWQNYLRCQ